MPRFQGSKGREACIGEDMSIHGASGGVLPGVLGGGRTNLAPPEQSHSMKVPALALRSLHSFANNNPTDHGVGYK